MAKGDATGGAAPSPDASGGGMMGRIGQGMGQIGQGMGRMGGIGYGGSTPPPQGQGGFMGNLSRMGAQMNAPQGGGTMQGSIGGMPRQGNPMFEGMDPQVARLFQMYSQSQRPQY